MTNFAPIPALMGGVLIGIAASLFLLSHGRVAGVSGLYGALFRRQTGDRSVRLAFVLGLVATGVVLRIAYPAAFASSWLPSAPLAFFAGLLVGFGTQVGNGCTSGHGVCGTSRLSIRSLVATATFMAAGMATVFVMRHLLGAGR
jgi:uncharacterized membrane protein YedE/YeeE